MADPESGQIDPSLDIYSPPPLPAREDRFSDMPAANGETVPQEPDRSFGGPSSSGPSESFRGLFNRSREPSLSASQRGPNPSSVMEMLYDFYGEGDGDGDDDDEPPLIRRASRSTSLRRRTSYKKVDVPAKEGESSKATEQPDAKGGPVDDGPGDDEIWDSTSAWKRFIVQFNITHFGIALGISAHMALWRALSLAWDSVPNIIWYVLWFVAVVVFVVETVLYWTRSAIFPAGVTRDFTNNRFVNFYMAPVIVITSILSAIPPFLNDDGRTERVFAYILIVYQLLFALYIYGEWLFSKEFSLQKIDPTYQMAVIGFFLVARVAAEQGDTVGAQFNLYVGVLFWLTVFISLFQNTAAMLSKTQSPSPTMFLFIAPPAAAAGAVAALETARGSEEPFSDLAVFFVMVDAFLFLLLLRLLPVWVFQKFNIAWWAYIFPLSTAAGTFIGFANNADVTFWKVASLMSTFVATAVILLVASLTVLQIFQGKIPKDDKSRSIYCEGVRSKYRSAMQRPQ